MRITRLSTSTNSEQNFPEIDLNLIHPVIEKYRNKKGSLIPLLQKTQEIYGYLPTEAFVKISEETGLCLSDMYGVATFYSQFRLKPVGKHIIKVCHGTACHVQEAGEITQALEDTLKIKDGEKPKNGLFTIESVACLGCCSLAPVMMIGNETYGKLSRKSAVKVIKEITKRERIN